MTDPVLLQYNQVLAGIEAAKKLAALPVKTPGYPQPAGDGATGWAPTWQPTVSRKVGYPIAEGVTGYAVPTVTGYTKSQPGQAMPSTLTAEQKFDLDHPGYKGGLTLPAGEPGAVVQENYITSYMRELNAKLSNIGSQLGGGVQTQAIKTEQYYYEKLVEVPAEKAKGMFEGMENTLIVVAAILAGAYVLGKSK